MRIRIGTTIMVIAAIHAIFGFVVFPQVWLALLRDGLFNSVGVDPLRGAVVWFGLYALPVFALGQLVRSMEKSEQPLPSHLFWYMLIVLVSGVLLMPASGFWLLLIPLALLWKRNHSIRLDETRTKEQTG